MAEEALPQVHAQPSGIGGWLVLPALGTLVTPFLLAKTAYDNVEALLTFQVSATLKAFIMIETLGNLAFSLAWFYALFLLWKHRALYPRLFNALSLLLVAFVMADLAIANFGFNVPIEPNDLRDLVRGIISCAIWVPYMLRSQRVRNTFVT